MDRPHRTFWVNTFQRLLDGALPPFCPVGGDRLLAPGTVGAQAWEKLHFIERPFCAICGVPFAADYGEGALCPACIADPPAFDICRAAVAYNDASSRLIISFKHSDRTELAPMFGGWLARAAGNVPQLPYLAAGDAKGAGAAALRAPVVTAVPLHWRRMMKRRYNQAALLGRMLAHHLDAPFHPEVLYRQRATRSQDGLSAEGRRRNLAGAVIVGEKDVAKIAGAHVVLVDDVFTTGATLSACARALKKAGARRVTAIALARVVKSGQHAI